MAINPKFAELEAIDAFAIAINLAYLNLPNLRFADRIKTKIRQVVSNVPEAKRQSALREDAAYRAVYDAGELSEIQGLPEPATEASTDGDLRTQAFLMFWCTPIVLQGSLAPFDKVISAIFLTISSLYMYIIVVAKLGSNPDDVVALTKLSLFFVLAPVVLLFGYFLFRHDWFSAVVSIVALAYTTYCVFWPGILAFPVDDPHYAMLLLAASVGITTWFVLASFALYPHAELHYTNVTKRVFRGTA